MLLACPTLLPVELLCAYVVYVFPPPCPAPPQSSLDARKRRGLIAGAAFGYSQAIIFWVFALLFYVGAVLVDDGTVEYKNFFTAMFAVIFGAFGVGQVSGATVQCWRAGGVLLCVWGGILLGGVDVDSGGEYYASEK